jgi:hypothetical protein
MVDPADRGSGFSAGNFAGESLSFPAIFIGDWLHLVAIFLLFDSSQGHPFRCLL